MKLTEEHEDSLRHMLGINRPEARNPKPHRDYAAVLPGDAHWLELERLGMVERYSARDNTIYHWYRTTPKGREAAFASHRRIRYSRSKRVYCAFLSVSDAVPDLTFRQFLTHPDFAEIRSRA
jgi:hypothetical protein